MTGCRQLPPGRHDQVVAPERRDRLAGGPLDGQPVVVFDLGLLLARESHEHVVVDQLVVAQRLAHEHKIGHTTLQIERTRNCEGGC